MKSANCFKPVTLYSELTVVHQLIRTKGIPSKSIFSKTATDIDAVASPLGAPRGSLQSCLTTYGSAPPIGGQQPPTQISRFANLKFFVAYYFGFKYHVARGSPPLSWLKILETFHMGNSVKMGIKILGGVALSSNTPLVAPPCGRFIVHFIGLYELRKMPFVRSGFLLPVWNYSTLNFSESG